MYRIVLVSLLAVALTACSQKDETVTGNIGEPVATPADSVVVAESTPSVEAAPAGDPAAEFDSVVEQYKGKQIPVDTDPATNELVYRPIELVDSTVQQPGNAEASYTGHISLRVPDGPEHPNSVYIFGITYAYEDGRWQYKSATEELQGGGRDKTFENPIFTPDKLK